MHPAAPVEGVAQAHLAVLGGQAIGEHPVQPSRRAGAGDAALGEGRHVQQACRGIDMEDFPLDGVEPAGAAKRPVIFLFHVASGEPVGPLPAELLAEHGAFLPHALVARRGLQGARGGALLVRIVDDEDMGVGLLVFLEQIIPVRVGPEPARLHAQHVYGGLPFDDPFRQLPTSAAGRGDAEAVALAQPEVFQPPSGADDGIAVRRVGDGPVIDLLDAALGKGRDAVHGGFDMGFQPL